MELDALATRVLFDDQNRAVGVEYLKGERLYQAHGNPGRDGGVKCQAFASRETILCGGAFNTPQLLMLSGIGPRRQLQDHGLEVRVDLPGVGNDLQDRYEISIVNRMKENWKVLEGAKYCKGDRPYQEWDTEKQGIYATNGGVLAVVKKSKRGRLPIFSASGCWENLRATFPAIHNSSRSITII